MRLAPRSRPLRAGLLVGIPALALATAAALAVAQAPPAGKDKDKGKGPAVVPFTMLPSNHMLVKAKINGKGPYRLIFDLGAPITLLGNRAGEGAGVIKKDAPRSFLMGMRGEAQVQTLEVGGLTATKLPVIVFDHPALKVLGDALGEPLDGIIGFTFFARYRTTIDYQKDEMTFEPIDFRIRDLIKELPDRLSGPKGSVQRVLAPRALWGLKLDAPKGGIDSPGVPIREVLAGSPAAAAGLKPGDVLTALGDRWTTTVADVFAAAGDAEPGKDARVVVLRSGEELTLTVRPADGA